MSSRAQNPNAAAVRANVRATATSTFGRGLPGAAGDPDANDTTAVRRQLQLTGAMGVVTSLAFSIGYGVVFSRLGDARDVCEATGSYLYVYSSLFLARMWLSSFLALVLFVLWDSDASQQRQGSSAKLVIRLRRLNDWFGFALLILGSVSLSRASPACVKTELYTFASVFVYLSFVLLILPLLIFVIIISALCCCTTLLIALLVRFQGLPSGPLGSTQIPATSVDIDAIRSVTFEPGMYEPEDASCAICMEAYKTSEVLRVLPCGGQHHFHRNCVDE